MKIKGFSRFKNSSEGSILLAVMFLAIGLIGCFFFYKRAIISFIQSDTILDKYDSSFKADAAYETAHNKIFTAVNAFQLKGNLPCADSNLTAETFDNMVNLYSGNEMQFLKDAFKSEACSNGTVDTSNPLSNFATAFPSTFTNISSSSGTTYLAKYTFSATPLRQTTGPNPVAQIIFEYEYNVQIQAYGSTRYSMSQAEDNGIIRIVLQGSPFSQWALFRSQTTNQNGTPLYFAGGDSSSYFQESFHGPVHTETAPYFYGAPQFWDAFTSAALQATWNQLNGTGYSSNATFHSTESGGTQNSQNMPTEVFNVVRLAAGDPGAHPDTNNNPVSQADLVGFLANYAGGTVPSTDASVPYGIYLPVDNETDLNATGGIYVEGDCDIALNVVQGSSQFVGALAQGQYNNIPVGDQGCKFQKISITSNEAGVNPKTIYVGADPCTHTYVFDASSSTNAPVTVNGRINGNIHVDGRIDTLGGESRTSPAIAQDFGITISALKDINIINDLQYEDVQYVTTDGAGNLGSSVVANAYGTVGASGYDPTSEYIAPVISSTSQTVLGLISQTKSVYIHLNAPSNINVDASIYAGNSAAYSPATDSGCGSATYPGCGFGVLGYDTRTGAGSLKLFGGISEYRSQTTGSIASGGTGYRRFYTYDTRLRSTIMPPAFVISQQMQAYPSVLPMRSWRVMSAAGF